MENRLLVVKGEGCGSLGEVGAVIKGQYKGILEDNEIILYFVVMSTQTYTCNKIA